MVACGTVDELTADASAQLIVHVPGANPGWAKRLPGVRVVSEEPGSTVLELDPDVDDQTVLDAARAAGPVREFRRRRPTLAELFRNVVTGGAR
jgi:ABC-2 type transport system ATP-binding protein